MSKNNKSISDNRFRCSEGTVKKIKTIQDAKGFCSQKAMIQYGGLNYKQKPNKFI